MSLNLNGGEAVPVTARYVVSLVRGAARCRPVQLLEVYLMLCAKAREA